MPYSDEQLKNAFTKSGEKFKELQDYNQELKQQFDQLQSQLRAYSKAALNRPAGDSGVQGRFWPGDSEAREFGELVVATAKRLETKDMSTGTDGGYLVPEVLSNWIIQMMGNYGKFRKNALVVPLSSGYQNVPQVTSDLAIYAPGEGREITKSDVGIGMVKMIAKKLACLAVVNKELEEDAIIALGEIVGMSMTRSMAKREDEIGFCGDATAEYFGMTGIIGSMLKINSDITEIPGLTIGSGTTHAALTLDDFQKVVGNLPTDADQDAKWYMSKKFYYNVVWPLARAAGVANIFEILSDRKSRYFLGYEVEFVHCMPSATAVGQVCAILGDLKMGAYLGERKRLEIARSDEVYFATDQIGIRGLQRIDVNAFGVGNATNPGSIVALATALE